MSIQSLRASLELLNTSPGARSSSNTPSRTIYHKTARDVMLIQGIHYAVEEALSNVGELGSSDPLLDPGRRCLLRLQQNLIDIARISENIQDNMLRTRSDTINYASTSRAPTIQEEPTTPLAAEDRGSVLLPTASILAHPCTEHSESDALIIRQEPPPCRPNRTRSSPSENLMYQATPERDCRYKRKAPEDDNHTPQPPPAKRPRLSPSGSIYLRPTYQKRENTSVFGWARWIFTAPKQ